MNYKRCAVRNKLKTNVIKTMANGLDTEVLSSLFDTEREGFGFLDDAADRLEKEIEKEYGAGLNFTKPLKSILEILDNILDENLVKETCSFVLMDYIRTGKSGIKTETSMKYVYARGAVEAEYNKYNVYQIQDKLENITLEAFIYCIIEELEPLIAARSAFTKACKEENLTKTEYPGWYEEENYAV